jgi:formylmethanofuran dehydrogenase subunit E-like metal-binding protein
LNQEAQQLASQGSQLQQSLNGALPAGAQSALNQASNSAKARIRSTYAASGLSGSTMEAQALAGVDQTVAAQGFQMADQLYQQGVQESGMASNLYNQIMQVNAQSDAALALSIGNFSAALAGGGSGISRNELKSILGG